MTLNVLICGAGRTGHLNTVLLKQREGVRVHLLTANAALARRHREGDTQFTAQLPDGSQLHARPDTVSCEARDVAGEADIVLLTVPAHARAGVLRAIAPHLPRHKLVYVGAIPGFCGFDWLAEQALAGLPNAVIWGMKDVPHTAHDLQPGVSVRMGGDKSTLYVATHAREHAQTQQALVEHLHRLYEAPVHLLHNYLEITLTPGNPIMHSSVVYGLIGPYGPWHGRALEAPHCWWSDCNELGAYFLERSDEESQQLCRRVEDRLDVDLSSVKPLKQEIVEAYGEQIRDARTMLGVLRTNRAYEGIPAPLVRAENGGWWIDKHSRAFHEDVAYGLALLVEMGRRLQLKLPHLEEIFRWNVSYMGGLRSSSLDYFPAAWPA